MSISEPTLADLGAALLTRARLAGLEVVPHPTEAGRLRVTPLELLGADLRAELLAHRPEVLATLEARWRWCAPCAWCSDPTGLAGCVLSRARVPGCPEHTPRRVPALSATAESEA